LERDITKERAYKKKRAKKGLFAIGEIIPKTVKRLKIQTNFDEYNIKKSYTSLFGKNIEKVSYPDRLIKKVLHITVSNSAWLMQLSYMKAEIIEKINERFEKNVVKDVIFKVGKISKKEKKVIPKAKLSLRNIKLDDETKRAVEESVKDIKDKGLKKSIVAAETAYYKRKGAGKQSQ
jgi:hypothetical protein